MGNVIHLLFGMVSKLHQYFSFFFDMIKFSISVHCVLMPLFMYTVHIYSWRPLFIEISMIHSILELKIYNSVKEFLSHRDIHIFIHIFIKSNQSKVQYTAFFLIDFHKYFPMMPEGEKVWKGGQ